MIKRAEQQHSDQKSAQSSDVDPQSTAPRALRWAGVLAAVCAIVVPCCGGSDSPEPVVGQGGTADASLGGSANGGSAGSSTGGSAGAGQGGTGGKASGGSGGTIIIEGGSAGTGPVGGAAGTSTGGAGGSETGGSAGSIVGGAAGSAVGGSAGVAGSAGEPLDGSAGSPPDAEAGADVVEAGPFICTKNSECDDSISCTVDSCQNGACIHWPGPNSGATACPAGTICSATQGCVQAPACSTKQQCEQLWAADACKVNIFCNTVTATCGFDTLDGDHDGHPPPVCGGDDCNDAVASIHPGLTEDCDLVDDNCDGSLDFGATCSSYVQACKNGKCTCLPQYTCPGVSGCVDTSTSPEHCGACGNACPTGAQCAAGTCVCPAGESPCAGKCINTQTDRYNCGACAHNCGNGASVACTAGMCVCQPFQSLCSGTCVWKDHDFYNCGTCGNSCAIGQTCQQGQCAAVPGGVSQLVQVPAPGGGSYGIDKTEVSRAQYDGWLSTNPSTLDQVATCLSNTEFDSHQSHPSCWNDLALCQGTNCGQHPQTCVSWCHATAYCAAVGKRLCGKIGGGPSDPGAFIDEVQNQWYNACSSAGVRLYTYGSTYNATECNALNAWYPMCGAQYCKTIEVGSMTTCQSSITGYTGVFDLSGNVMEWEDSCWHPGDSCRLRGGHMMYQGSCKDSFAYPTWELGPLWGFRCCSK